MASWRHGIYTCKCIYFDVPCRSGTKWGDVEFPLPFGRTLSSGEDFIHGLDEATGASLKFTVLNPKGRVW